METLTQCKPSRNRIPLSQRMPKAFLARLDRPALRDQKACLCIAPFMFGPLIY